MLSNIDGNLVKTVWHEKFYDACKSRLSDDEFNQIIDELNNIVKSNIENKDGVVVSSFIPGSDWSDTVWDPIYSKACIYDEEHSAQFFGLLVCQVLIDSDDIWYFLKQDIARGMIYFRKKEVSEIKQENLEVKVKLTVSLDDLKNKFGD